MNFVLEPRHTSHKVALMKDIIAELNLNISKNLMYIVSFVLSISIISCFSWFTFPIKSITYSHPHEQNQA